MTERMKVLAAVVHENNAEYQFENVEMDTELADDEVLVEIKYCGICRSDESVRAGYSGYSMPIVLGHEGAGIVKKIGPKVTKVVPGDHVVLGVPYCGECEYCHQSDFAYCSNSYLLHAGQRKNTEEPRLTLEGHPVTTFFGQSSFAKMSLTYESNCMKVDKDVDLAVVAPMGCGIMTGAGTAINYLKPGPGEAIVIFGVGSVGLSALMGAALCGSTKIIAVDINDKKLEFAKEVGATDVINNKGLTPKEIAAKVIEAAGGRCVNYSIETSGVQGNIDAALMSTANFGEVCVIAAIDSYTVNQSLLMVRNLKVSSIASGCTKDRADTSKVLNMLVDCYKKGKLPIDKMITKYKFSELNSAIEDMNNGKVIKPVLVMDE